MSYLEKLACNVFVHTIMFGEFKRHVQPMCSDQYSQLLAPEIEYSHVQAIKGHPSSSICLTQYTARRQRLAPVESSDVIEPQKSTFKHVVTPRILAVHPPSEVKQKLLEDTF